MAMFCSLDDSNEEGTPPSTSVEGSSGEDAGPIPVRTAVITSGSSVPTEVDTQFLMTHAVDKRRITRSVHALPPASLSFRGLGFTLPPRRGAPARPVLEPCSGHFESGELSALMGPSGSGKTTLLDMLANKKTAKYQGHVWVNGKPRSHRLFHRVAAYVGQEDIMPAHWKVREAVQFNAILKQNPARVHRSVDGWIDTLLETFGLFGVQDSLIGGPEVRGISGGQRRRVSLARGVAAHASLLFCDEPTSGLSATDAELCVKALQTICKRLGVTCIVVIHQPRAEVADLFDKLVLLTSDPGRMVYFGPMDGALPWWKDRGLSVPVNVNPADFFMDTVTPGTRLDASSELAAAFELLQRPAVEVMVDQALAEEGYAIREMITASRTLSGISNSRSPIGRYALGFCGQLRVLLVRKLRLTARNPVALGLPLLVPIIQGVIVGWMFAGTGSKPLLRQVMFAFCMLTMLCLAGTMSLIVLITERTLMKYEASEALYSELAWALATQLVDVPLALLGACLNVCIMVFCAQCDFEVCKIVLLWSLFLFFVYDSLFAFIGAVAADTRQAQVLATPFVSIFMLFNGFIVTRVDAPFMLQWIFDVSPNAYAMQAIVVRMGEDPASGIEGQMLLAQLGYSQEFSPDRGIVVLAVMIVVLRAGQLLGLKYLNDIQR